MSTPADSDTRRVWDLPVRVLHWTLAAAVATSFLSYQIGAMQLHGAAGVLIITVVLTRLVWGVIGSDTARFSSFARGPAAVKAYARSLIGGETPHSVGHNPLGGWAVFALLASCLIQALLGLFSHAEDIDFEGPLAATISEATSAAITGVHEGFSTVVMIIVGVHIAANVFYLKRRNENLIRPMWTGEKASADLPAPNAADGLRFTPAVVALLVWGAVAGAVLYLLP